MSEEKFRGKVKFFNSNRYFGFITRDDSEKDIFFHGSDSLEEKELEEGDEVEFELKEGEKGLSAVKVSRVDKEAEPVQEEEPEE